MRLVRCYELCEKALMNLRSHEYIEELIESCPSYMWECAIRDIRDNGGTPEQYTITIRDLQSEMLNEIASGGDWMNFKSQLMQCMEEEYNNAH